jgi:hypothetical protein
MVQDLILVFLIVGGFIGWSLFAFTVVQLVCNRQKEIEIINEIKEQLKIVKQEVKNLK